MEEFEEFGEGSADEVQALFGRTVAGTVPVVGFTPDGIAAAGRTHQRRRRAGAVLGATASVAAVALAVSAFGGAGGGDGRGSAVTPGADGATTAPTTAPTTRPVPLPTASVTATGPAGSPKDTGKDPAADDRDTSAAIKRLLKDLDPAQKNLAVQAWSLEPGQGVPVAADKQASVLAGWGYSALWTRDGAWPATSGSSDPCVVLQIDILGPAVMDQMSGQSRQIENGAAVNWGHRASKTLLDGSVVTTASLTTGKGTSMIVERRWRDGRSIVVDLDDASAIGTPGYPSAVKQPYQPFPFTEASLAQALSDPELTVPSFK